MAADPAAIIRAAKDGAAVAAAIAATRATMLHILKSETVGRPVLSATPALIRYLTLALASAQEEQLRILFLNARNELLRDEQLFDGSATGVVIRARPIIKRALELGATALILVHNHPSGNASPSQEDIRATERLTAAATPLEIAVHDHIIVAGSTWSSLRTSGLLRDAA